MKQDFTSKLKDRLADYQEPVPEDLWAGIESRLAAEDSVPVGTAEGTAVGSAEGSAVSLAHRRPQAVLRWVAGIAASVALFIGGWYTVDRMATDQALDAVAAVAEESGGGAVEQVSADPADARPASPRLALAENDNKAMTPSFHQQVKADETPATLPVTDSIPVSSSHSVPVTDSIPVSSSASSADQPLSPVNQPNTSDLRHDQPEVAVLPSQKLHRRVTLALRSTNPGTSAAMGYNSAQPLLMASSSEFMLNGDVLVGARRDQMYLANNQEEADHSLPLTLGLSVRLPLTPRWWLESGLSYTYLSSKFTHQTVLQTTVDEQRLHYVGIPLNVGYNVWQTGRLKTYVSGGVQGDVCVKSTMESQSGKRNFDRDRMQFSFNLSAGAELQLLPHSSLYFQPGLSFYPDNGSRLQNIYKERSTLPSLQFGLRYSFE